MHSRLGLDVAIYTRWLCLCLIWIPPLDSFTLLSEQSPLIVYISSWRFMILLSSGQCPVRRGAIGKVLSRVFGAATIRDINVFVVLPLNVKPRSVIRTKTDNLTAVFKVNVNVTAWKGSWQCRSRSEQNLNGCCPELHSRNTSTTVLNHLSSMRWGFRRFCPMCYEE